METKRLTATEREGLLRMNVALEILTKEPEQMKNRVAMIPGAKRDIAMMAAKIRKLMEGFRDTIPEEQQSIYEHALRMTTFTVGAKSPTAEGRDNRKYGMWIPISVLNELLNGCHDHCMVCDLDKGQRRACPLKKALDIIPNDAVPVDDGCPYYTWM